MADIRIKDLSSASSSASDDFIAIDGTTNGTRKLNAFSPTFGGNATVTGTLTANTSVNSPQLVISDNSLGLTGGAGFYKKDADTVALGVMTSNTLRAWIRTTDARWFYQSGTPVTIQDTTASTSTSSGALVVSGGVGVAGNTVVGGASFTTGDGSGGPYLASSSVIDHSSGQARFYGRGANTSTRATLGFYSTYSDGTGGITLQTFDVSGNATFGASIKTSAPSGGTAAAWKLGTVATVSPTSPNRTIEVDIGGTIYYIHAKTTNN